MAATFTVKGKTHHLGTYTVPGSGINYGVGYFITNAPKEHRGNEKAITRLLRSEYKLSYFTVRSLLKLASEIEEEVVAPRRPVETFVSDLPAGRIPTRRPVAVRGI